MAARSHPNPPESHARGLLSLGGLYRRCYALLCGEPPFLRPWHFQWLALRRLRDDLGQILPTITGALLDVGCGAKPYAPFLNAAGVFHTGIDVSQGAAVDFVVAPDGDWPFADESFDAVLCTQVLEHVAGLTHTTAEIDRVLKPGGVLIVSVPFIYQLHGAPEDFRRLSAEGLQGLFDDHYHLVSLRQQGAIGSALAILWLGWLELTMTRSFPRRVLWALLLPLWLPYCLAVNSLAVATDSLDHTGAFYHNVLTVLRKH